MITPLLEVIALDAVDARHARDGGADRVELVSDMAAAAEPGTGDRRRRAGRGGPAGAGDAADPGGLRGR
ncbi:hypothetical protein OHA72_25005 [Dactylosporangium sp. NBC_01737]|uniref:hypothetical protein n=1 Tax=Dactylosporangium sp. NBC_01737 TaxID=2975959 RepID=UPI002E115205|nr:hypothetical protein OHA72_25005 [Dactylosporangium sp. NBC_01737]